MGSWFDLRWLKPRWLLAHDGLGVVDADESSRIGA